jgi:multiple sugar transport system substrate-binding protein
MYAVSRRFSLLIFLMVLAMLVASCTPSSGTSGGTSGGTAATTAPAATTALTGTTTSGATGATTGTLTTTTTGATSATTGTVTTTGTTSATTGTVTTTSGLTNTGTATTTGTMTTTGTTTGTTSSGAAGAAGGATLPAAAIQLPSTCNNVTIQYWTPFTGPDGPFMGKLVNAFNAANPNIKANFVTQPDYVTKLTTAAASNTLPDLTVINEDQIATMAYNHVIAAFTPQELQQIGVSGSEYPATSWAMGTVNGQQYAIPLSIVPLAMYYNQDLLTKAGISAPPTNEADFTKAAQAMTQGNTHGFMITSGFPVQQIFQQLLHQFGGTEFNADTTKATWDSAAGVQALQWMVNAQQKYAQPKLPVDADLNAFKAGQAGMIWNGIWQLANVTGSAVSFKSGATAVPQIGPHPAAWAGEASFALPLHKTAVDPCKQTASLMLIQYLLNNSAQWAGAGNIPALNRVRASSQFQSMQPYASIAPEVENPTFLPAGVPGVADAFTPLGNAVGAVMSGGTTDIQSALTNAANSANQILAQNKQKYGSAP